jgi:hypothetical protein
MLQNPLNQVVIIIRRIPEGFIKIGIIDAIKKPPLPEKNV